MGRDRFAAEVEYVWYKPIDTCIWVDGRQGKAQTRVIPME